MASDGAKNVTTRRYTLQISRQESLEKPETHQVDERVVDLDPQTSVLAALHGAEPSTEGGGSPVAYEGECFEGVCGACSMLVNGRVRLACTTSLESVADKRGVVRLAPLTKFPLVGDLVVDRSRMTESQKRLFLFEPVPSDQLAGPALQTPDEATRLARLDTCMQCGACLEACPQYSDHGEFVGAQALHQLSVKNLRSLGAHDLSTRLQAAMAPEAQKMAAVALLMAQNCVEVCPEELPLADSLQSVARQTTRHMILGWLLD